MRPYAVMHVVQCVKLNTKNVTISNKIKKQNFYKFPGIPTGNSAHNNYREFPKVNSRWHWSGQCRWNEGWLNIHQQLVKGV